MEFCFFISRQQHQNWAQKNLKCSLPYRLSVHILMGMKLKQTNPKLLHAVGFSSQIVRLKQITPPPVSSPYKKLVYKCTIRESGEKLNRSRTEPSKTELKTNQPKKKPNRTAPSKPELKTAQPKI